VTTVLNFKKSNNVGGVVSLPAEPPAARHVVRGGKVLMPSAQNGSIIAVSYEARARGVSRFFRGREALAACPDVACSGYGQPTGHLE
jgi:DNA polymerase eta